MLLFGTFDRSAIPSTDALAVLSSVGSQIGLNLRIREFQRRASEVDKLVALGTMAAGLSHEIRNPLVSVQTLASLLKGGKSLAKVSGDYKEVLIRDIRRIEGIVDGVAAYSKNQKAHTSIISISEVITASISIYESQAKDKHVAINFDRKINPDVNVLGNFDQLAQVFNNLIENALHAVEDSEERRVEISIRLEKSSRPAKWVAVTVADTGKGVPESIKDRVFDPFITSKDTGHREENVGMGLGLAISKRIVENHDGLITIADKRESGAMFVVSLKIHQSP
jgi:two-component system nitrogen regulation sensor histidine kinase GlnL